jgi:hypothetical protein
MKKLYWICACSVLLGGLYAANKIKIAPETSVKVHLTQVSTPEEMGQMVFAQLREDIRDNPLLLLGVTPNKIEDIELLQGFLAANQENGSRYDVLIAEPQLPYIELFKNILRIDIKDEMSRFVEGLRKAREQGLRIAVITPNIYSSQLLKRNPADRLKTEYGMEFLSLSVTKFPLTREQEESFEPKCIIEDGRDLLGTGPLGCVIQKVARQTYKQKLSSEKSAGLMEQVGQKDYLIFFNR